MCGVPPFTPFDMIDLDIDGDAVTVYIDPPALDRPVRLTVPEARALGAALDAAGYAPDSALRRSLLEISSATVPAEDLERTVRTGTAAGGLADLYSTLALAVDENAKVRITYLTGSTGRVSDRVVHPYALVNRLGVWYLVALCEQAAEERVFRLDRIRSAVPTGEEFTPPDRVPLSVTPETERLPVAEIRLATGAPVPDDRTWPGVVLEPAPDGSITAFVGYQSVAWIARRVVAYLGQAEVVGPPEVREAVAELAATMLTALE
jgi:predicted DNA-binding transcriptional regulator YafY